MRAWEGLAGGVESNRPVPRGGTQHEGTLTRRVGDGAKSSINFIEVIACGEDGDGSDIFRCLNKLLRSERG